MEGMTINRGYASPDFLINKSRIKLAICLTIKIIMFSD